MHGWCSRHDRSGTVEVHVLQDLSRDGSFAADPVHGVSAAIDAGRIRRVRRDGGPELMAVAGVHVDLQMHRLWDDGPAGIPRWNNANDLRRLRSIHGAVRGYAGP